MTDRRNSRRARTICVDTHSYSSKTGRPLMDCHVCKAAIDLKTRDWRADHIRRWAEGGRDTPDNLFPICLPCDRVKAAIDTREVAKGKRTAERNIGIRRTQQPMPGSRNSPWRRRMDGTVERR
jgi:5-methylcytosine-specific restriction enzyme A